MWLVFPASSAMKSMICIAFWRISLWSFLDLPLSLWVSDNFVLDLVHCFPTTLSRWLLTVALQCRLFEAWRSAGEAMSQRTLTRAHSFRERIGDSLSSHPNELVALFSRFADISDQYIVSPFWWVLDSCILAWLKLLQESELIGHWSAWFMPVPWLVNIKDSQISFHTFIHRSRSMVVDLLRVWFSQHMAGLFSRGRGCCNLISCWLNTQLCFLKQIRRSWRMGLLRMSSKQHRYEFRECLLLSIKIQMVDILITSHCLGCRKP